eukprot:TRINITY_DN79955_c0_g1_i1.p1 TRINITY_DN79955_c0_g1~~TRINITY_DN79955_c0_g1_i1.p1  ORF type:complete len:304 (+),score=38.89 TRINITY_DN79955_c0_g1_i1:87-998(+)
MPLRALVAVSAYLLLQLQGIHGARPADHSHESEESLQQESPQEKEITRLHGEAGPAVKLSAGILEQENVKSGKIGRSCRPTRGGRFSCSCIAAEATAWRVPCRQNTVPRVQGGGSVIAARVGDLQVGDCVLDGDSVTQIFFRNILRKEEMETQQILEVVSDRGSVNLTANHLVPSADVGLVPAMYLLPGQAAGGGLIKKLTVHRGRHEVVMLYTLSGKILLGGNGGDELKQDGIIVSTYVHGSEEWTNMDTRLIFQIFGRNAITSMWYQAFFWLKQDILAPTVYYLWPYKAHSFISDKAALYA